MINKNYVLFSALFLPLIATGPVRAWANAPYEVKPGDTLSGVLYDKFDNKIFPIFGPEGLLQRTQDLNPAISDPNLIYPGRVIILPLNSVPSKLEEEHPPLTDQNLVTIETPETPVSSTEARSDSDSKNLQVGLGVARAIGSTSNVLGLGALVEIRKNTALTISESLRPTFGLGATYFAKGGRNLWYCAPFVGIRWIKKSLFALEAAYTLGYLSVRGQSATASGLNQSLLVSLQPEWPTISEIDISPKIYFQQIMDRRTQFFSVAIGASIGI